MAITTSAITTSAVAERLSERAAASLPSVGFWRRQFHAPIATTIAASCPGLQSTPECILVGCTSPCSPVCPDSSIYVVTGPGGTTLSVTRDLARTQPVPFSQGPTLSVLVQISVLPAARWPFAIALGALLLVAGGLGIHERTRSAPIT